MSRNSHSRHSNHSSRSTYYEEQWFGYDKSFVIRVVSIVVLVVVAFSVGSCALSSLHADDSVRGDDVLPASDLRESPITEEPTASVGGFDGAFSSYNGSTFDTVSSDENLLFESKLPNTPLALTNELEAGVIQASKAFSATETYENSGIPTSLSYVVLDIESGLMISQNANKPHYCASTFKAVFCAYVLQQLVENGQASLDDDLTGFDMGYGYFAGTTEEAITETLIYSDNSAYDALRMRYADEADFAAWLESCGCSDAQTLAQLNSANGNGYYPDITAADLSRCWLRIGQYMQTDTECARLLADRLSQTLVSTIREDPNVKGTVYNKCGWINDDPDVEDTTAEGALVTTDSGTFLMVYQTNLVYDIGEHPDDAPLVQELVDQILQLRSSLRAAA